MNQTKSLKEAKPTGRFGWIIAGAAGALLFGGVVAVGASAFASDGDSADEAAEGRQEASVHDDSVDESDPKLDDDESEPPGSDESGDSQPPPGLSLSYEEAGAVALAEVGEGFVTEVDLDDDNGGFVWEIDVYTDDNTEHELKISAEDGSVLKHETDHDDDGWDD